jgi:hypothetical protein
MGTGILSHLKKDSPIGPTTTQIRVKRRPFFNLILALPPVQGEWGEVNDTQCNYVSEVTDKLYKFANMNHTGFHQTTLLQAAGTRINRRLPTETY